MAKRGRPKKIENKDLKKENNILKHKITGLEYKVNDIKSDRNNWIFITCILVVGCTLLFLGLWATNGSVSVDDKLGPYMCNQHNLVYDHADVNDNEDFSLKIYCKEPTKEKQIEDGYLVVI